ncbi:cell death-inducing p53-target protein 1 isoform X2 [Drosophila hydei]|nr:cell death-inducing p53-target protein 1 isoform X2 [Drosophila hydei]XP_023172635.2 cell death-inducing p53-target protein 1 isoform X2 [Drosophila hydei]XP_030080918.1 cell death-inducing p53-target protein 1 isoform X2 [Drosophila hydei]
MKHNKLSPQPPPYSQDQYRPGPTPSAPPNDMIHTAPMMSPRPDVHVTQQHTVIVDNSGLTTCPRCQKRILMRVKYHATCTTYCWSALLCLFLCWPCVCLPCCCDCGYTTSQVCPKCNAYI